MKRKKKIAVVLCSEGAAACRYGCTGCGLCEAACRLGAVSFRENGTSFIDRDRCAGCGLCVKSCPFGLILLVPSENTIQVRCANRAPAREAREQCPSSCIGCGLCEKNCPAGAIHVEDGVAVIDQQKCIACGMCTVKCPRGVIRDANGIFTEK